MFNTELRVWAQGDMQGRRGYPACLARRNRKPGWGHARIQINIKCNGNLTAVQEVYK